MNILELIKHRRSIRKYEDKQISRQELETVMEAGLYAPSAGGGQGPLIYAVQNKELCEKIGRLNIAHFDRSETAGMHVSEDQPSIIDDPSMKSGFYGAPTVCVILGRKDFLYSVADAFCCAENMVLAAAELGLGACIIGRGEETFDNEIGAALLTQWGVPEGYTAQCFVLLGYCRGDYPAGKARKENRVKIIEA